MKISLNDVMVDIETLGTSPRAVITAIGACSMADPEHTFMVTVDTNCSQNSIREQAPETIAWWKTQPPELFEKMTSGKTPLRTALLQLNGWLARFGTTETRKIWGNGAAFDPVILDNAYRQCNVIVPWSFRNVRCARTIFAEFKQLDPKLKPITPHDPVADAVAQAMRIQAIYNAL